MSTQLTVEIDTGSASSRGRPPNQAWMVRLRRAYRCVIVAVAEIVDNDQAEEEVTPLAR